MEVGAAGPVVVVRVRLLPALKLMSSSWPTLISIWESVAVGSLSPCVERIIVMSNIRDIQRILLYLEEVVASEGVVLVGLLIEVGGLVVRLLRGENHNDVPQIT